MIAGGSRHVTMHLRHPGAVLQAIQDLLARVENRQ
jgi:hypothetical protein